MIEPRFLTPRNKKELQHLVRMRGVSFPQEAMHGALKDRAIELNKSSRYPLGWIYSCLLAEVDPSLRGPLCEGMKLA